MTAPAHAQAIAAGNRHAEAFCLMHYRCKDCLAERVIWNSRDGVTPFVIRCRDCEAGSMQHFAFHLDRFAPDHKPALGDYVFKSMTRERAAAFAKERLEHAIAAGHAFTAEEIEARTAAVADSLFMDGHAPDLVQI